MINDGSNGPKMKALNREMEERWEEKGRKKAPSSFCLFVHFLFFFVVVCFVRPSCSSGIFTDSSIQSLLTLSFSHHRTRDQSERKERRKSTGIKLEKEERKKAQKKT